MEDISKEIINIDDSKSFTMIAQGNTAEIFAYSDEIILKLFRKNLPLDAIANEWQSANAISFEFGDTPKALGLVQYRGRYGILYEKIMGNSMMNVALRHPFSRRNYGRILADIHLGMHRIEINQIVSIHEKLVKEITYAVGLTDEEKQNIISILNRLPAQNRLCHLDFHPGNIIVFGNRNMVIDWMTACRGVPACDVARTVILMTTGEPMHTGTLESVLLRTGMRTMRKSYMKRYIEKSGISREEIQQWMLPIAAARLSEWVTEHERERLLRYVRTELKKSECMK